ncbi:hypothetical protein DFH08DRAFT_783276 [Mycena albidolilacea]|uniref:NACHT domain-containing protein n=1 Tax=Mycena albidolilacea TaxID=1033008 RepID=A0AAD6ZV83_9AGAR|nr:hypothetical protein DFH08DRAFT_783276 [Mycena albidolilacea]
MQNQQETDGKIVQLVQTMAEVYTFAKDADSLSTAKKHLEDTVTTIVQQTAKCAIFVREYTRHGFLGRLATDLMSDHAKTIQYFVAIFVELQQSLNRGLQKYTAFAAVRIEFRKQYRILLQTLRPAIMDASLRLPCLAGTRCDLLSFITTWLTMPSDSTGSGNILWLYGVAGAGKSTIATSISQYIRVLDRFGAFLFFTHGDSATSSPSSVIPTIAFGLAQFNTHLASAICAGMDDYSSMPMAEQFQKLLLEPLNAAQGYIYGPIVVILDALDECGDPDSRKSLISILANDFPKLPSMFRFFVTSRPDSDIATTFLKQPKIVKRHLDIKEPSSIQDIQIYIDHEVVNIRQRHSDWDLPPTWPDEKMTSLVNSASGLFIWASTAMKLLLNAYDPNKCLDTLIHEKFDFAQDAGAVLAAVVLGKVPMSDETIDALLGGRASSHILPRLGCVLQWAPGQEARILHASFRDYLTDSNRSGHEPWFINPIIRGRQLTSGCLQVMKVDLQFNICRLEDSHIHNSDVHDLPNYITTYILPQLSYSSRFWADHLETADYDDGLLEDIQLLVYSKFLYRLEVLSVLQETPIAINALVTAAKFAEKHDNTLVDFLTDAAKFVVAFAPAIASSVPHIYLSAVPLTPTESKVAKQYSGLFIRKRSVQTSSGNHWPQLETTIEGHTKAVRSVAFSPNGKYVVSGANDGTVRMSDARTGALVTGPLGGHTEVTSVAFSPDGDRIVSGFGDATILVWDAHTGGIVAGPFEGHRHRDVVYSVSFSPDGTQIVSGSNDATIHMWDAYSGAPVHPPFIGHTSTINCVVFSPGGEQIVSGSTDETVCVWDVQTGALLAGPFRGHSDAVYSVSFSPDGERIVSGSEDGTVHVWDVQTGALVAGPFQGHSGAVYSVSFSPDGEQVVSGSKDTTIRVWDVRTGALIATPLEGHTRDVLSIAFSPDGKWIASGSHDRTVCSSGKTGFANWQPITSNYRQAGQSKYSVIIG